MATTTRIETAGEWITFDCEKFEHHVVPFDVTLKVRYGREVDAALDRFIERERALDHAILGGFDRDRPVDLDAVIARVYAPAA